MQLNPRKVRNILVVRNDRFGEFILSIPALGALKAGFPDTKIVAVVNPVLKDLALMVPFIDELIEWENKPRTFGERLGHILRLRRRRFDMAVMLNPSKEFNIMTFFAGIPVRVGYDRKWPILLTHKRPDKKYLSRKHEIEYNLELVDLVGAKTDDVRPALLVPDIDLNLFGIKENSDYIVLHPWTSDPIKKWPSSNFKELSELLINELGFKVVIVGGKEESFNSAGVFDQDNDYLINLTGLTDFRQLAAVIKKARLLVSCDSGPVHLAGCFNLPVLALFRNDLAGKSSRRWGPVSSVNRVIESSNLSTISVDQVFKAAKELLTKR